MVVHEAQRKHTGVVANQECECKAGFMSADWSIKVRTSFCNLQDTIKIISRVVHSYGLAALARQFGEISLG